MGRLRMVAHTSSSKGVNIDEEYVRVLGSRFLRSSVSSLGRQREREEGERRYCRVFKGSLFVAGVLRAERRGVLLGSVDWGALRFLDAPLLLESSIVSLGAGDGGLTLVDLVPLVCAFLGGIMTRTAVEVRLRR